MKYSSPVCFILDTNILVKWIQSYLTETPDNRDLFIRSFCETAPHPVVVPDIVWLELVSFRVHRNIQLGVDHEDTLRLFRDQQTLIQQLEQMIRNRPNWRFMWRPASGTFPIRSAVRLMQNVNLLDRSQFRRMQARAAKNYERDKPKLLDGLDSLIMIYGNELALIHPDHHILMFTADYPLSCIINGSAWKTCANSAPNFRSLCALHTTIRCRSCQYENPADMLLTDKAMWCGNPDQPRHLIRI